MFGHIRTSFAYGITHFHTNIFIVVISLNVFSLSGSKIKKILIGIIYNIVTSQCFFLGLLNVFSIKFASIGTPTIIRVSICNIGFLLGLIFSFFQQDC